MHVFTYGSLMYRQVWQRVVRGEYHSVGAGVRGYARWPVRGEVYPALVPANADDSVVGVLYRDVSDADLAALDRFESEGDAYRRIPVSVRLDGCEVVDAWTYVYMHPDRLEPRTWEPERFEPERFEAEGLPIFLDTYCRDRAPG